MLGNIIRVEDTHITVKLNINIYETNNLNGKYVIFAGTIVGSIIEVDTQFLTIKLVGLIENNKFIYGSIITPPFNSEVRLITKEELDIIYSINEKDNYITLGTSYIYNNYNINMNVNNYFSNHFAILGNTGSGKSYSVAKIIHSIFYDAKYLPFRTNIFLFDAYGEYQQAFRDIGMSNENINYKVYTTNQEDTENEQLYIPFWLLNADDIALLLNVTDPRQIPIIDKALKYVNYFSSNTAGVTEYKNSIISKSILDLIYSSKNISETRNQIITILTKFATEDINLEVKLSKGGWVRSIRQCLDIDKENKFADVEVIIKYLDTFTSYDIPLILPSGSYRYTIDDYASALEFALISEGIFTSDKVFDYANILKIRLNSLCASNYASYFNYDNYIDIDTYIKQLLTSRNGNKAQVVNFNINYVDDRFAKSLVKIYARLLFNYITNQKQRGALPFHIILEEAHRYVQNDKDVEILGYKIFDRIAKEGRKYGVILGLVSQRPFELSETAISQCSNFLIFKMFHPKDLKFISDILPDISDNEIKLIKNLNPGVCMIFGNAFKIPLIVKMDKPHPEPNSQSINIDNIWYIKNNTQ